MQNDWFKYDRDKGEITVDQPGRERLVVKADDLHISHYSGGPGGQNVNRHMNGVQLIFDIPESHLLPYKRTRRLIARSLNNRSLERNRDDAMATMAEKIRHYFYVPPTRKKTRVPNKSKRKRIDAKKRRGQVKSDRKKVDF